MGKNMRLLIVEDSENDALLLLRELRKGGYQPEYKRVDTEIAMVAALENEKWDIILSDYAMPQFNGLAALKISQRYKLDIPFIIVSGTIGEDVAVEAMKAGAHDYLMKGNLERLTPAIDRELHDAGIRREHKLSLIKLRQTEGIVASSHDMMALLDKNFIYLYANDAYLKAFGKTRDQVVDHSASDIFGEEVFKTTIKPCADRCFEGKKARYQEWFDFPILGHRYLDVAYTPYTGETNVVNEFVIIARDITELKQTQEDLSLFRNLIDQSNDAVFIIDPDKAFFLDVNKKACTNLGYTRQELLKIKVTDIEKTLPNNFSWENHIQELKEKQSMIMIGDHKRKDGICFPVEVNAKITSIGQNEYMIAVARDITERKMLETKLIQAQKMEAIGTLAGGIAHDFNNILSAIMGFAQLILADVKKGSDMEDDLQEIITAGLRARDLINQVLVFARQSDQELIPMRVDLVVKEVLKLIRSSIPTSIEIKSEIKSKSRILGNPTQCHQILMNLCTNAAYAMEQEGGILDVSLMDTDIKNNRSTAQWDLSAGEYIRIEIKDTGVGIPENIIKSIFDPYFTTKPLGEGTGMGLSVVHGIVESYGGKIFVDSIHEKGTAFRIFLPITKRSKENVFEYEKDLPVGTEHILVVDDEISITKLLDRTLKSLGYTVTVKNSGIEALELFKIKPNDFDLVVTDMTMPNITGDKLAVEMIAIRPNIPVILCTGYSKKINDQKALEIGTKAFVHKPIISADLAKTIRTVLDDAKKAA